MTDANLERIFARAAGPQRYPAYLYVGHAGGKTGLNGWRERLVFDAVERLKYHLSLRTTAGKPDEHR